MSYYDETGPAQFYDEDDQARDDDRMAHDELRPERLEDSGERTPEDELAAAMACVNEWRFKGLWPPQEVQERLARARIRCTRENKQ